MAEGHPFFLSFGAEPQAVLSPDLLLWVERSCLLFAFYLLPVRKMLLEIQISWLESPEQQSLLALLRVLLQLLLFSQST